MLTRRALPVVVAVSLLSAVPPVAVASSGGAAAAPGCSVSCGGGGAGWTASASYAVTVTVGGGGQPSSGGARTFSVPGPPPRCYYMPTRPAAEHPGYSSADADVWWESRGATPEDRGYDSVTRMPLGHEENLLKEGRYWSPVCQGASPEEATTWFDENTIVFVEQGQSPPAPAPPSAEELRLLAEEHLVPPPPEVSVNPEASSFVNLPTWVWTDTSTFQPITVVAEAASNRAEVSATPSGMKVSSDGPGRQQGTCASGGTRWSAGAVTDCTFVFERASAASGTWTLSVETEWAATYLLSTGESGELPVLTESVGVPVEVAEVQSLVTGS